MEENEECIYCFIADDEVEYSYDADCFAHPECVECMIKVGEADKECKKIAREFKVRNVNV